MLAWCLHADNNNQLLAPNDYPYLTTYAATQQIQATMKNWAVGTMAQPLEAVDLPARTGKSELMDPNTVLSPYVPNGALYHCPANIYIDPNSHIIHVRSYSMNSAVGTTFWSSFNGGPVLGSPVQGGWLPGNACNANQLAW